MSETIRVNFAHSIPLFPLPDTVLLPHAVLPLHIFELRYRQMVSEALDRTGQIAIATYVVSKPEPHEIHEAHETDEADETNETDETDVPTPVRDATCIGQIIQHESLPDGRYNILLHGICRARIRKLLEPKGQRAYRLAMLDPIEPLDSQPAPMPEVRAHLRALLTGPRLKRLRGIDTLMEWIDREDVPTHALIELIGFALVRDTELKYRLLAEPDARRRAGLIKDELKYLVRLVLRAERQDHESWPKGLSWN